MQWHIRMSPVLLVQQHQVSLLGNKCLQEAFLRCMQLVRQESEEHLALSRKAFLPFAGGWAPLQTRACKMEPNFAGVH